jgi:hypothetical protein
VGDARVISAFVGLPVDVKTVGSDSLLDPHTR